MTKGRIRLLAALVMVLGLAAGAASLTLPLAVDFTGDPILRLLRLEAPTMLATEQVPCDQPDAAEGGEGPVSLYELVRDNACDEGVLRRVLTAVAAGALVMVIGFLAMTATTSLLRSGP